MTKDRARKRAVRARTAATAERHVVSRRRIGPPPGDAVSSDVPPSIASERASFGEARAAYRGLVEEFRRRGWPLEVEHNVEGCEWLCYPGPARVGVGRGLPFGAATGDEDPDDEDIFDLTGPVEFHLSAPLTIEGGRAGEFDISLPAPVTAGAVADTLAAELAAARSAGMAVLRDDGVCAICEDRYPRAHLLSPSPDRAAVVCPACIFDGDLLDPPEVAYLAYQIDRRMVDDLAAPAGWAAVGALLSAVAPDAFAWELASAWRAAGSVFEPMAFWDDPGGWWIWVNAPAPPLAGLRPGTSAARLAETIRRAHPQRHRQVEQDFRCHTGMRLNPQLWTAAVAYLVAFDTQARDRPRHRGPWHVLESFDAAPSHWTVDGFVIGAAVDCVRKGFAEVLGLCWHDYLGSNDEPRRRGLEAAYRFADLCQAGGWQEVEVSDQETDNGQAVSVDATSQNGTGRLVVTWHESDETGRARFAGGSFADCGTPTVVKTVADARRCAEQYRSDADPTVYD